MMVAWCVCETENQILYQKGVRTRIACNFGRRAPCTSVSQTLIFGPHTASYCTASYCTASSLPTQGPGMHTTLKTLSTWHR